MECNTLIIGAGPAGLTAAIYSARAGKKTVVLAGAAPGGQALETFEIENYPGFKSVDGVTLMASMTEQASAAGAEILYERAVKADLSLKSVSTDTEKIIKAEKIIIATGAKHRKLSLPGEENFIGKGVSFCAVCDGGFFRKKHVAVVGGGDSALTEALYLSGICDSVTLIHRREEYRAAKALADKVLSEPKIRRVTGNVTKLIGKDRLERIEVLSASGDVSSIDISGLFVAIGTDPDTQLVAGQLELDEGGYIVTDALMETSVKGVFAAGDVRATPLRQIVTACADGAIAAK